MVLIRRFLILFLVAWLPAWCASLNHTVIWDVETTGSNSNGGGFDPSVTSPGTDMSRGSAVAFTDLVVGGTTTTGTSTTLAFSSASPGNVLNVTGGSGCTVQRVEILSVSGSTATFNASLGSAADTCTGTAYGPLATVAQGLALTGAGDTVNLKAGTYTQTTALAADGGASVNFNLLGYNSTPGDLAGIPCATVATCPVITTATNSIDLVDVGTASANGVATFKNIHFSNTAGTRWHGIAAYPRNGYLTVVDSVLDGFDTALKGDSAGGNSRFDSLILIDTEVKNCTTTAIASGDHVLLRGNYIHNNGGWGFWDANGGNYQMITMIGNVFYDNTTIGAYIQNGTAAVLNVIGNVFDANTTDGLKVASQNVTVGMMNNIFYGNGGYGLNTPSGSGPTPYYPWGSDFFPSFNGYNFYGGNGTAGKNGWPAGPGDGTLGGNPFVSDSGGNFALTAAAAAIVAGFPGIAPFGTGYLKAGALQPASGGQHAAISIQ